MQRLKQRWGSNVDDGAAVCLSAALEYVATRVVQAACSCAFGDFGVPTSAAARTPVTVTLFNLQTAKMGYPTLTANLVRGIMTVLDSENVGSLDGSSLDTSSLDGSAAKSPLGFDFGGSSGFGSSLSPTGFSFGQPADVEQRPTSAGLKIAAASTPASTPASASACTSFNIGSSPPAAAASPFGIVPNPARFNIPERLDKIGSLKGFGGQGQGPDTAAPAASTAAEKDATRASPGSVFGGFAFGNGGSEPFEPQFKSPLPVVNNAASIWDSPSQTLLPPTQTPDGALTATATKSGLTWSPSTKDRCGNFDIVSDHFSLSSTPPRTRRDVPNALLSGHAYRMLIGVLSI